MGFNFFRGIKMVAKPIVNTLKGLTVDKNSPAYIQSQRVKPWFESNGDKTFRLNYDLRPDSIVFDLGGYEGQWASDIYAKYNCSVLVFEPYLPFAENIEERFVLNPKIKVFPFGLGAKTEKISFSFLNDASSVVVGGDKTDMVEIVDIDFFMKANNISKVDLVKINIEGSEYELLEYLINKDIVKMFKNIQVQFHDFLFEGASVRMSKIKEKLSTTHTLTYEYEFVWENWMIKQQ